MTYYRAWCRAVEQVSTGLNASLLVRHPDTEKIYVNFDSQIMELIHEAKYMSKLQLTVPEVAINMCKNEQQIKENRVRSALCFIEDEYLMCGSMCLIFML